MRRLEDAGIPVVIATGNVRPITYGLWRFLGLSAPMCCENGGVLWHPSWEEPVLRAKADEAKEAAAWLATQIEGVDARGIATNRWRESEWCLYPDDPLEAITEAIHDSPYSHLSVVRTGFAIHLMEPHLSKGEGLQHLFDRMGWSPEDALCVGDAPNDFPCLNISSGPLRLAVLSRWSKKPPTSFPHPHGATFLRWLRPSWLDTRGLANERHGH